MTRRSSKGLVKSSTLACGHVTNKMSLLKLLIDRLLTENICCPTFSDVLAPEVATWIDKSTKINLRDRGFGNGS